MKQSALFVRCANPVDIVYTPDWCAQDMVRHFNPAGRILDPCKGAGVFLKYLPVGTEWCEIGNGRDFYEVNGLYDWIIGNPPYSDFPAWLRRSLELADDIAYLIPCRNMFSGPQLLGDLYKWGGIVQMRHYGGGNALGFPFGNAIAAFHFQKGYRGDIRVSHYTPTVGDPRNEQ